MGEGGSRVWPPVPLPAGRNCWALYPSCPCLSVVLKVSGLPALLQRYFQGGSRLMPEADSPLGLLGWGRGGSGVGFRVALAQERASSSHSTVVSFPPADSCYRGWGHSGKADCPVFFPVSSGSAGLPACASPACGDSPRLEWVSVFPAFSLRIPSKFHDSS